MLHFLQHVGNFLRLRNDGALHNMLADGPITSWTAEQEETMQLIASRVVPILVAASTSGMLFTATLM